MDPKTMLAQLLRSISEKYAQRLEAVNTLKTLRGQDAPDESEVNAAIAQRQAIDAEIESMESRASDLRAEIAENDAAEARAAEVRAGAALPNEQEREERVEARDLGTYNKDNDPKGKRFMRDLTTAFLGSTEARTRLETSTREVFDRRAADGNPVSERAAGTANATGFAIPEYLTDLFAPNAKEGAQLANEDNMTVHDLPETGMTAYLPKAAANTTVDVQASQGDAVSETDFDDDLISIPIITISGAQSFRRQVIDRAPGFADEALKDLIRSYYTDLDSKAINRATTGMLAAGTAITYTDASPTAIELYGKILQGIAAVEDVLKDQAVDGDLRVAMRRNRWRWLQNQFIDTHPFISGRQAAALGQGVMNPSLKGVRGYLPSDDPVVTDSNIPANLGSGTNEDRVLVYSKGEAHLWTDPNAPLMIRAEQSQSKTLTVDYVVYGYAAFCFTRYSGAVQVIGGTGLVTPTF
jgi:hypothetical protein